MENVSEKFRLNDKDKKKFEEMMEDALIMSNDMATHDGLDANTLQLMAKDLTNKLIKIEDYMLRPISGRFKWEG